MSKFSLNSKKKIFVFSILLPIFTLASTASKAGVLDDAISTVADGFDYVWPDDVVAKDFNYRLGLGVGTKPDYKGSDNYSLRVLPLIDVQYKNRWTLQGTKLRVNLLSNKILKFGPLLNYRFGRSENNSADLKGMGDTSGAFQFGAFAEFQKGTVMASAEYRHALGGEQGSEAVFILGNGLYKDERWLIVAGIRAIWNDKTHTQTNYGVDEVQAIATGYDVTQMSSGFSDVGINFITRYQLDRRIRIESIVGYSRILGSAADSPIVKLEGNANQGIFGVGLRYSF
ncbi:MAG: MipA/OmpV family protein [Sphingomonadales bacterium]|nr:MipA/OmpV family protein [Sphingomonadales bacterium]